MDDHLLVLVVVVMVVVVVLEEAHALCAFHPHRFGPLLRNTLRSVGEWESVRDRRAQ